MNKAVKAISLFVFIIGLGMVLYPKISKTYYDVIFRTEVEQLNQELTQSETTEQLYTQYVTYNTSQISRPEEIPVANVGLVEDASPPQEVDFSNNDIIASIAIPAIDLLYPIYDGATDGNLLRGVARITGTSYPVGGVNTNSVIAGHNGLRNHTFFTNINQLVAGDLITIQNRAEQLTYEIYGFATIAPDDVSALAIVPGQDTLTLLTCTYDLTQRYLVYAKRVANPEPVESAANRAAGQSPTATSGATSVNQSNSESAIVTATSTSETAKASTETAASVGSRTRLLFSQSELYYRRYGEIILYLIGGLVVMYFIFLKKEK